MQLMSPVGTAYYTLPTPLAIRGESPIASSTYSDVTMSDLMEGDFGSSQYDDDGCVGGVGGAGGAQNEDRSSRSRRSLQQRQHQMYGEDDTEEDEYDNFDDDSNHLQTTGSLLEYSDTSEDYTTHYTAGSQESKGKGSQRHANRNNKVYSSIISSSKTRQSKPGTQDDSVLVLSTIRTSNKERISGGNTYQHPSDDVEFQKVSSRRLSRKHDHEDKNPNSSMLSWITKVAYSFRSPQISAKDRKGAGSHYRRESAGLEEYPHHSHATTTHRSTTSSPVTHPHQYHSTTAATGFQPQCPPKPIPIVTSLYESISSSQRGMSSAGEYSPLLGSAYFSGGSLRNSESRRPQRQRLFFSSGKYDPAKYRNVNNEPHTLITLAAAFLQDYEANRPPTFGYVDDLGDVTRYQTSLHKVKFSHSVIGFPMVLWGAVICMFASSSLESFNSSFRIGDTAHSIPQLTNSTTGGGTSLDSHSTISLSSQIVSVLMDKRVILTVLNMIGILILAIDMWIRHQLRDPAWHLAFDSFYPMGRSPRRILERKISVASSRSVLTHEVRTSRAEKLIKPLIIFCAVLAIENVARLLVKDDHNTATRDSENNFVLFSSIFKPLVLFYVSSQARDAFEAVSAIMNIVLRVLLMELLLILMFAAVACRLFPQYEAFANLWNAWLSLFELATTVVNPSLWMPMYATNHTTAIFFVTFVITSVFYLHSLVLSVVFQTYLKSAGDTHERSNADREVALHLAYESLLKLHNEHNSPVDAMLTTGTKTNNNEVIDVELVRETLKLVRPHYNAAKINALVEIVNPSGHDTVDLETFRTKIRQALNASLRTPRNPSALSLVIELVAALVGIVNFAYVIIVTSTTHDSPWFFLFQEEVGCGITLVAALELLIRFNPIRIPDFTPLTRFNATFDGLAIVAAVVSSWGIILFTLSKPSALEWILMGRSIDIIRAMRFFPIFRDVVRRSGDILPAMLGPVVLVFTTVHTFCYLGMALWGGAVTIGAHNGEILDLYDYNNFNSYQEGIVTMFQILVVNDWNAIALVFRLGDRHSSPLIVYPFFVGCNLIGVNIMLNVMTAFFVESFVTKLNDDKDAPAEITASVYKEPPTRLHLFDRGPVRRISTNMNSNFDRESNAHNQIPVGTQKNSDGDVDVGADADSETSSISEMHEFDVYEREGFDKIMQTVAGAQPHVDYARQVCHYLEVFEGLALHRESVGYLVCDQQSLERFGNRRFRTKSIGTLEENELHATVTDMHSELVSLPPGPHTIETSIIRTFQHKRDPTKTLEISASLLRRYPALSLFVSRLTKEEPPTSSSENVSNIAPPRPGGDAQPGRNKGRKTKSGSPKPRS